MRDSDQDVLQQISSPVAMSTSLALHPIGVALQVGRGADLGWEVALQRPVATDLQVRTHGDREDQ